MSHPRLSPPTQDALITAREPRAVAPHSGVMPSPAPSSLSSKRERSVSPSGRLVDSSAEKRRAFFSTLASGGDYPLPPRDIEKPGDLDVAQLKKCFEILHACGSATNPSKSLQSTEQEIEDFLELIFDDWSSTRSGKMEQPKLRFNNVIVSVKAGKICNASPPHESLPICESSELCRKAPVVWAQAQYHDDRPVSRLSFFMHHNRKKGISKPFCPTSRTTINWAPGDVNRTLRELLQTEIMTAYGTYNKKMAVWQARNLILKWARGSLDMGEDVSSIGFLGEARANAAVATLESVDQGSEVS